MSQGKYLLINGEPVTEQQATISVRSVSARYGASVFEGIRAYKMNDDLISFNIFALTQHIDRLNASLKLMQMPVEINYNETLSNIEQLIKLNNILDDAYIRIAVFIIGEGLVDTCEPCMTSLDIYERPSVSKVKEGVSVCFSDWIKIDDHSISPKIKCAANYQNSRLALLKAKASGFDTLLHFTRAGKVAESPNASFFMIKNNALVTPTKGSCILDGITRKVILEIGTELGLHSIEGDIDRTECYLADEAFLCGTACEILPINQIDHYPLQSSKEDSITHHIKNLFFEIMRSKNKRYNHYSNFVTANW